VCSAAAGITTKSAPAALAASGTALQWRKDGSTSSPPATRAMRASPGSSARSSSSSGPATCGLGVAADTSPVSASGTVISTPVGESSKIMQSSLVVAAG
jgi:hypothetical protein